MTLRPMARCDRWRAVPASGGSRMFVLLATNTTAAAADASACAALNAPSSGPPLAWGAATCDPKVSHELTTPAAASTSPRQYSLPIDVCMS
jgi:hypothetical protein